MNCAVFISGYNKSYRSSEPSWEECEAQILRLFLSFLSVIGMVDVAYTQDAPRISDGDFCVGSPDSG
ncbi:MAG: hypothetical protein FWG10_04875 [Eubacteriaceae bacterium]|nr:hypothetical protein [Eubacteriaceae bacterium]